MSVYRCPLPGGGSHWWLADSDGQIIDLTAKQFVNSEEPLANLLEVMRHLMSHNGHLKTAIIP